MILESCGNITYSIVSVKRDVFRDVSRICKTRVTSVTVIPQPYEGWVWDLDSTGAPSRLRSIRKDTVSASRFPIFDWRFAKNAVNSQVSLDIQHTKIKLLFIIRVNREIKRVYRNGCRYNERLNSETGGSKTPRTHWVARVNI